MDSNTLLFPTRGPYSGTSTPKFDFSYDDAFGTPRPDTLFNDKTDYFSMSKLQTSGSGLTPYALGPSNLFGGSPYPNPMDITPPQTATDPPPNWPYGQRLEDHTDELSLPVPQINTGSAKIQFGQTTPPDEEDRAPDMKDLNSAYNSKSSVKRESTISNKSTKSNKRSKKNKTQTAEETNEENEKRSKFLERNRVAASKCRQKKKEHNGALEQRAKDLERMNNQLKHEMNELLSEKTALMMQMAMHTPGDCDCHQIHEHLASFKALYRAPLSRPHTANSTGPGSIGSSAPSPSAM